MGSYVSLQTNWIVVSRPVQGILIPDGTSVDVEEGTEVAVVQELGGDYTVRSRNGRLLRIDGQDGDAIGREAVARTYLSTAQSFSEEAVQEALRACYDPEIPINIMDLGLVYELITQELGNGRHRIQIQMTLTAPGCGMGQVLVNDVRRKVESVPGVEEARVDLVFDPPWDPTMMSEAARLQTGMF